MYYKLYIDSVFFVQFVMNLYLLSVTGKTLKCTATHGRILLGALLGAGMMCLVIVLPLLSMRVRLLFGIIPVSMCMLRFTFAIKTPRFLIKSSVIMAVCGFFFGSIVSWLSDRLTWRAGRGYGIWTLLLAGFFGYVFLHFLISRWQREKTENVKDVIVFLEKQNVRIKALLDTGNHLWDPISQKPVCIISEKAAKEVESCFVPEHYHVIPYQSIGNRKGFLHAYELPALMIEDTNREIYCRRVIVAICNTGISKDSIYQMILNPQLMEN